MSGKGLGYSIDRGTGTVVQCRLARVRPQIESQPPAATAMKENIMY